MHRSIPLLALLALAACSPHAPDGNHAAATPTPTPASAPAEDTARAAPADTQAPPKPGALKTFGDWAVGCDNVGDCTMASLGPEGADFPAINLLLTRTAGPAGAITATLYPNNGDAPAATPASITVDGRQAGGRFGGGEAPALSRDGAVALAAAMINGQVLAIRDAGGKLLGTLSLKGASAALRYIDAQQGRAGTLTAIVVKGSAPASNIPARPAPPRIAAVAPAGERLVPDATMIADMKQRAQCDDSAHGDAEAHALGGGATLVLLPCSAGAYNLISAVFVVRGGTASPARMDAPSGFTESDQPAAVPMVVNSAFTDGLLTSLAEGRGLGDCGVRQEFVWDGSRFRLSRQAEMGECRGDPNYITTWTTEIQRR